VKELLMFIDKAKAFSADGGVKRVVPRTRVLMNAQLVSAAGKISVRIRDLSPTGAHVTSDGALPAHGDLLFCRGQASVAARVVWVRRNSAGVTFYRELSAAESDEFFPARERAKAPTVVAPDEDEGAVE
jgi:hypothetical protein